MERSELTWVKRMLVVLATIGLTVGLLMVPAGARRGADADRDGLPDTAEVEAFGTDPADADSDDDGLKDGAEVRKFETSPLDADSDDDGTQDGQEDHDEDGTVNADERCRRRGGRRGPPPPPEGEASPQS